MTTYTKKQLESMLEIISESAFVTELIIELANKEVKAIENSDTVRRQTCKDLLTLLHAYN